MGHAHARAAFEHRAAGEGVEVVEARVESVRDLHCARRGEEVSGAHVFECDVGQAHGHAVAGGRLLHALAVHLHRAHARAGAGGEQLEVVARYNRARPQRARHHGAEAAHGKGAVDGHAHAAMVVDAPDALGGLVDGDAQLVQACAGAARAGDDGTARIGRALHVRGDLAGHELDPLIVYQVGLCHGDDQALHAQYAKDRQVLHCLRHDAVVGRDHEQGHVDAGGAGHHLAHEALVARHVDHAHRAAAGQLELGKAELDGDAAALFLLQAVRVGAGEGTHEGGLAVVDVARRAEHERGVGLGPGHGYLDSLRPCRRA